VASQLSTGNNGRTNAQNITQLALLSCLGQWNDWVPSNTRYFVNRWKSDALPPLPDLRMKILDQLVAVGAVEVYDAPNGDQALRTLPGFLDRPEDEPEAADED
jgi:hypothetical protein